MYNNKYANRKVTVNDEVFDSRLEARRYQDLQYLERAGEIKNLQRQVPFELQPGYTRGKRKIRPIIYIADFTYLDKNGLFHVEDTKGFKTKEYTIKKKMFEYKYDYEITEITKDDVK